MNNLRSGFSSALNDSFPMKSIVTKTVRLFSFGLIATALAEIFNLDLGIASYFYVPGGPNGGWIWAKTEPWNFFYRWGEIIPIGITAAIVGVYVLAYFGRLPDKYKKCCVVVVLTVILGPGLMVNGVLKDYWGRPRPADIVQFGGESQYRSITSPGGPGAGKSAVCGHCSVGFAMASLVAFYPYHPTFAVTSFALATLYGIALGITRIVQGGHFFTDVIWAAVLVYYYLILLYYFFMADWRSFWKRTTSHAHRT